MRINVILKCTECGEENYLSEKNKRNTPDRLEQKKYCPRCKKSTIHKEKNKKYENEKIITNSFGYGGNSLLQVR